MRSLDKFLLLLLFSPPDKYLDKYKNCFQMTIHVIKRNINQSKHPQRMQERKKKEM